jgi:putative nucleotidyltransferase with HDIG domain
MDRKTILFIDDDTSVLRGLQRSLYSLRKKWDMHFEDQPKQAVELAKKIPFDAVVTDMKMPVMDGVEVLEKIAQIKPDTFRLVLSGHSGEDLIIRATGNTHQFITKPCEPAKLREILERLFLIQDMLANSRIICFMPGINNLPSLPDIYVKIERLMESENSSVVEIAETVAQDLAMTAKVLQLVNSAFFGVGRHISNTLEAVKLIGLDALKALVLSVGIFHKLDSNSVADPEFSYQKLLEHSLIVATLASKISRREKCEKKVVDDCFISGMMHDLGYLILEENFSSKIIEVRALVKEEGCRWSEAEERVFGATHGQIGAYLLGIWGLPTEVVEAVAYHHSPSASDNMRFGPLAATHVAEYLVNRGQEAAKGMGFDDIWLDESYLQAIGKSDRLSAWSALAND